MKYRIVKVERAEDIWYEAHYRKYFMWFSCFSRTRWGEVARYDALEDAELAINRHKRLHAIEKRTLVVKQ